MHEGWLLRKGTGAKLKLLDRKGKSLGVRPQRMATNVTDAVILAR
jgi:hypothetical protein